MPYKLKPPKLTQIAIPPTHHIWRRDSSQSSSKPKRGEVQLRKYRTHSPNLHNLAGSDWGISEAGNRAGKTQPCKWERISLNGCQWPLGTWMWTQHQIRKEELRFPLSSPVMSNLYNQFYDVWWLILWCVMANQWHSYKNLPAVPLTRCSFGKKTTFQVHAAWDDSQTARLKTKQLRQSLSTRINY